MIVKGPGYADRVRDIFDEFARLVIEPATARVVLREALQEYAT